MSRAAAFRRFLAARWIHALDAAIAALLTAASTGALEQWSEPVLRAPASAPPPPLPAGVDKNDYLDAAIAAGYEVVPMRPAAFLWWAFTVLLVVALLIQRRWPVAALVLAVLGGAGHYLDLYPFTNGFFINRVPAVLVQPIDLAVPIVLLTTVSKARTRWTAAILCLSVLAAAYVTSGISVGLHGVEPWRETITGLPALLTVAVAFTVGDSIRSHRAQVRILAENAADLEREQQRAELATAAERARIAREMHDVVAHSLSVMVAQAQAAVAAQQRHPERTAEAMGEVVTVGRASLAEMRRLLGVLGPGPADGDGRTPQPGLDALPALIDRVRAAGVPVRFEVVGAPVPLPSGVDLSAYRIVQQALTNTLEHAGPGASAAVHLRYEPGHVDLEVTDDGIGATTPAGPPGNGLRGIAERVGLHGGELTAGPGPERGFGVRARLPIPVDQAGDAG